MLSTEEKIERLENLLIRIQKSKTRSEPQEPFSLPEYDREEIPQIYAKLPSPQEPQPVVRISRMPEPSAEPLSENIPAEPVPVVFAPEPEPETEFAGDTDLAAPEPESETEPQEEAGPRDPEAFSVSENQIHRVDSTVQASSQVMSIQGEIFTEWTLRAVLKRAWSVGNPEPDEF